MRFITATVTLTASIIPAQWDGGRVRRIPGIQLVWCMLRQGRNLSERWKHGLMLDAVLQAPPVYVHAHTCTHTKIKNNLVI